MDRSDESPTVSARLPERAWKPRPDLNRAQRSNEQNRAAGGGARRIVLLDDGRAAVASVILSPVAGAAAVRMVLRWSADGRRRTAPLGETTARTRAANLRHGWSIAQQRGLVVDPQDAPESWASTAESRASMRSNRGRDTRPELALRKLVHRQGLRYRVSVRPLPGLRRTADLVFPRAQVAVFVDGCFWHGCPDHGTMPVRNHDYWSGKIDRNRARDHETDAALTEAGWTVVRIWEHVPPADAAQEVVDSVRSAQAASHGRPND